MLAGCYVLAGPGGADDAQRHAGHRLHMPVLGCTLGGLARSVTGSHLGCPVELVWDDDDGELRAADHRRVASDWLPGPKEQRVSRRYDQWVLLTDGCALVGIQPEHLSSQLRELSDCDAALICADQVAGGYREEAVVDRDGRVTAITRRYPTDLAREPLEVEHYHILMVRRGTLRRIFNGQMPCNFAALSDGLARAGVEPRRMVVPARAYRLMVDDDVLRFQADVVARCRRVLPPRVRQAGLEPVFPTDGSVFIADSAVVHGPIVLGKNVRILSEATVLGPCTIGDGAVIGRGCLVRNSVVLPGVSVPDAARVESRIVQPPGAAVVSASPGSDRGPLAGAGTAVPLRPEVSVGDVAPLGSRTYRFCKRVMDIAIAVTVLLLCLPIFAIVAVVIKIDSRGPLFYIGRRQTRGGRQFGCIKFRTMVPNAKELEQQLKDQNVVDGLHIDIRDDPRMTRIGSFLRRTNIDELPQFINVLMGDMSMVGPRPSPDNENRLCPAWREARLAVLAGVTGLWQICRSSGRGDDDFQQWIYYDTEYVRYQSLWLDIRILLKTGLIFARGLLPAFRWLPWPKPDPAQRWWRPRARRRPLQLLRASASRFGWYGPSTG